jgi:hypothetical protein
MVGNTNRLCSGMFFVKVRASCASLTNFLSWLEGLGKRWVFEAIEQHTYSGRLEFRDWRMETGNNTGGMR